MNEEEKRKYIVMYEHLLRVCKESFEDEKRRGQEIRDEAARQISVCSIVIAAMVALAPTLVDNRGTLSTDYIFWAYISISVILIVGVALALAAQRRTLDDYSKNSMATTKELCKTLEPFYPVFAKDPVSFYESELDTQGLLHESLKQNNDMRVGYLNKAKMAFFAALVASVFLVLVACCIMY